MTSSAEDFVAALRPVVTKLGASVVLPGAARPGDLEVVWENEVVAYVRPSELHGALERYVGSIENEVGTRMIDMSRADKQAAVRRLDEQGAFLLRGAVEDVAASMGVSKVTLYSYLNAISGD